GVVDPARGPAMRRAQGEVVDPQPGQRLAAVEAEVVHHEIARGGRGRRRLARGQGRGEREPEDHRGGGFSTTRSGIEAPAERMTLTPSSTLRSVSITSSTGRITTSPT